MLTYQANGVDVKFDGHVVLMDLTGEGIIFRRFIGGEIVESYAAVSAGRAAVYAAAFSQGLEPPRGTRDLDMTVFNRDFQPPPFPLDSDKPAG
jgi:hypothetical protein